MATNLEKLLEGVSLEQVPDALKILSGRETARKEKAKADAVAAIKKQYNDYLEKGIQFSAWDFAFIKVGTSAKAKTKTSTASTIPRFIRVYKGETYPVTRGKVPSKLAHLSEAELKELKKPNPEHPANKPKAKAKATAKTAK